METARDEFSGEAAVPKTNRISDSKVPQPSRNPSFDECEPPQQIQSLRRELLMLRELVNSQQMLLDRLMVHQHATDGSMLVPMRSSGAGLMGLGGNMHRRDPLA